MNTSPNINKPEILEFIKQIGEQEKHFNGLETEYRKLTSTWLLAAMGACGYILSSEKIPFDPWLLISGVGFIASIGIYVLYVMDLNVYHQLLDAYFIEGVRLEVEHHEWVRPIRIRMLKSQQLKGVTGRVLYYYFISITLLMGIANFGIWNAPMLKETYCPWIVSLSSFVGLGLLLWMMNKFSKNEEAKALVLKYDKLVKTNE